MTIYNEAVALAKLCELNSNKNDKKLVEEIFENTKGLIDLYLESNSFDSKLEEEEIRQILAKGLLEAIATYQIDMVVPFSVYAYYKMDNILEEDIEYLKRSSVSLDKVSSMIEDYQSLSSLDSLDDIQSAELEFIKESLTSIDINLISSVDEILKPSIKQILMSLTQEERIKVLKKLNVSYDLINIINQQLNSDDDKNKSYLLK